MMPSGFYYQNNQFFVKQYISIIIEILNSGVTKLSYETELRKIMLHFQLLTENILLKFFFQVTNFTSEDIKLNFD